LLIPQTVGEDARVILERVRQAVSATSIDHADLRTDMTISLGGTSTLGDEAEDKVLFRADEGRSIVRRNSAAIESR
jgi:PleD family two-component response regulator